MYREHWNIKSDTFISFNKTSWICGFGIKLITSKRQMNLRSYNELLLTFRSSESLVDGFCRSYCCLVYSPVEEKHYEHWYVERA